MPAPLVKQNAGNSLDLVDIKEIRDNVVDYIAVLRFRTPPDCILRPEMTTAVSIDLQRRDNVLALPAAAVHREEQNRFVLVRRGNAVERRPVTTGIRDESYQEILSGVREGDVVLAGDAKNTGGELNP